MTVRLRLLLPDKKGVERKVKAAVAANGGRVLSLTVAREMRGQNEVDLRVVLESGTDLPLIIQTLERVSVTVVGVAGGPGAGPPAG